jgi:acyl carrier protein
VDQEKVLEIVRSVADSYFGDIDMNSRLDDLNWDSLSTLAFISQIDSAFGKQLSIDSLVEAKLVSDLVRAVAE